MLKITSAMESRFNEYSSYTGQLGYDVVQFGLKLGLNMIGVGFKDINLTNKEEVSNYID